MARQGPGGSGAHFLTSKGPKAGLCPAQEEGSDQCGLLWSSPRLSWHDWWAGSLGVARRAGGWLWGFQETLALLPSSPGCGHRNP